MSTTLDKVNGHSVDRGFDAVALAEADAIRKRAEAEAEERRIAAEAEAEALKIKAAEEAEKQRIANERARLRLEREQAEHNAKIAEANRKREEADREREKARRAAEAEQQTEAEKAEAVEQSSKRWRHVAKGFYALCAAVALPVQMAAFYKKGSEYLLVAPVFIEVIALVALVGAAAAVTAGRPHWHYRLVAWAGALTAATINIVHGLDAFDPATAFGTALASVAGPGMWDLHEHGRIRVRDGKLSWRERRAKKRAEKKAAKEKAAEEARRQAEKKAAAEAAEKAAKQLAAERAEHFPQVWEHAVKLAAALGETTVTEAVWKRAHRDIEGTDPGESVDIIRTRNTAARRIAGALSEAPGEKPVKVSKPQDASQVPGVKKPRVYSPPARRGVRRKGDTKYAPVARRQMSVTAKSAAQKNA